MFNLTRGQLYVLKKDKVFKKEHIDSFGYKEDFYYWHNTKDVFLLLGYETKIKGFIDMKMLYKSDIIETRCVYNEYQKYFRKLK